MRWTKGQPASKAPCGIPLLVVELAGAKPRYLILKRERGASTSYGGAPAVPTWTWEHYPGGQYYHGEPDRYWLLPGREHG